MRLAEETLNNFRKFTGFDVRSFLQDFIDFSENYRTQIINYYRGDTQENPKEAFSFLNRLIDEVNEAISVAELNKDSFDTFSIWNLFEELENIRTKLNTTLNFSKYLRSSVTNNAYNRDSEVDVTLNQNETLEQLANNLGYPDPQNDWIDIALRNNLQQEDYTTNGDVILSVSYKNSVNYFQVNSVVDNIQGKNILGKDIQHKLEFDTNNNDIKILSPEDTFRQAIKTLARLKKRDNPFYPKDGLDTSLVIGSSLGGIAFPSLFRQMNNNFNSDDTIASFTIRDIRYEQNSLIFDYEVESKLGEIENDRLSI